MWGCACESPGPRHVPSVQCSMHIPICALNAEIKSSSVSVNGIPIGCLLIS